MGRTPAPAKCTAPVRAFDLPKTSGSIGGPGVEGGRGRGRGRGKRSLRVASHMDKLARMANPRIPIGFLTEVFPWAR